jgi:TrmH family RNA methyltransferase
MPVRIVQSKQNARLKELRRALARPGRDGLVAVEGPVLIEEALRSGLRIHCLFATRDSEPLLGNLPLASKALSSDLEVLLFPRATLDSVLTTESPQSAAALIEPPDWTWAHLFRPHQANAALILILAGIQDPGNLGTIVRSAEAFGASGIVCLPGTVSPWNPKAVRASAGSIFRLPLLAASEQECFEEIREAGVRILTTLMHSAHPAYATDLTVPCALIIGNEGNGVPANLAAKADDRITIPCPGAVESLNAALATSVLLYEAARQRATLAGSGGHRGARR